MKLHVILSKNSNNDIDIVVKDVQDIPISNTRSTYSIHELYSRRIAVFAQNLNLDHAIKFALIDKVDSLHCTHCRIIDSENIDRICSDTIEYYKSLYSKSVNIGDEVHVYDHTGTRIDNSGTFIVQDIVIINFAEDEECLGSTYAYICKSTITENTYVCFKVKKINNFKSQVIKHNDDLYELIITA